MTDKWRCFPVALCVLSLGCGGKKPEAPDQSGPAGAGKPAAASARPAAVAEAPKVPYMSNFRLGSSSGPDGIVAVEGSVFKPGEPVCVSFEIPNAPPGSKVRVAWTVLPDKKPVSRQEAPLVPEKPAVSFKADSKGWPIGDFELEMSLVEAGKEDARFLGTAQFKLAKPK